MTTQRLARGLATAIFAAFAFGAAAQQPPAAQPNVNVRGTITGFDGKVLSVKSRDGTDLKVDVPDNANISTAKAFTMADIKPGMMLAVSTIARPDGTVLALDVRPLPPTANGSSNPYDLQPGSVMNNAAVDAMVTANGGQELTLNYKTGTVKALVVPQTTMSQAGPGTRDDLKVGETIFAVARPDPGDKLTIVRVQVSKDGVKPGQ